MAIFREAALAGPRLIARAPLPLLAWTLIRIAQQYASLAVLIGARQAGAGLGVGAVWSVLVALPFEALVLTAILRAELKPEARAFAFLRAGQTELRMAGLLILAGLVGVLIALPASVAAAYVGFALRQRLLAGSSLAIGSAAAILALARFAPVPAMLVDHRRVDIGAAWRASQGRYGLLAIVILAAAAIERGLGDLGSQLISPAGANGWPALFSPLLLASIAWRSLVGVASLAVMAGAAATVWRASRQTLS